MRISIRALAFLTLTVVLSNVGSGSNGSGGTAVAAAQEVPVDVKVDDSVGTGSGPLSTEEQVCTPGDDTCQAPPPKHEPVYEATVDMDATTAATSIHVQSRDHRENIESYDDDDDYSDAVYNDPNQGTGLLPDYYDDDDDMYDGEPVVDSNCRDEDELCAFWAQEGECQNNPGYMLTSCAKSCNTCKVVVAPKEGYGSAYGVAQECEGDDQLELVQAVERMDKYMSEEVSKPEYDKVRSECKNRNKLCVFWAHIGECEANPSFMLIQCAPACQTCKNIDYDYRCPKDPSRKDIFGPGDLHKMFERIVEEYDNVTVLSQPPKEPDAKFQPWVIYIDDFVSNEECDRLVELGAIEGYERSTDVGEKKFDGTYDAVKSATRTSENAWCHKDCYKDPMAQSVMKKIETLTGIPESHSEFLQLLRYVQGQFYRVHHDYIEHDEDRASGPRVLTAYLYLNDVEAGGGTNFPDLDLTVMPKKGRLLLWPSVIDSNPSKKDFTTRHQALDVEAGEKYGANAWLHLRDFKTPHKEGCT